MNKNNNRIKDFEALKDNLKEQINNNKLPRPIVCVMAAEDLEVLNAIKLATDMKLIKSILVGRQDDIKKLIDKIELNDYEIINTNNEEETSKVAVQTVRDGKANVLMKGLINTSTYMRAILNKEWGIRGGSLLSSLAAFSMNSYHKLLFITDSGVNVAPNLETKKTILINALNAINRLGINNPKIAILCANEMVDAKIPCTTDARDIVEMINNNKSNIIPSCTIEGPIAFDVAFSKVAASIKGINSQISEDVDLLLMPNIESGNILAKSWLQFNNATWGGMILGAKVPVILSSRSDDAKTKLNSIALSCAMSTWEK